MPVHSRSDRTSWNDQTGNQKLTNIMGDTAGNTDTEDAEVGVFFFITVMTVRLKSCTGQTVQNTEKISEHESDDKDTDDRNKGGFFPGIIFQG